MDFTAIGKLSSYVKTKNLMFAAKHKIRTGQTLTNANGNLVFSGTVSTTFDKLRDAAKAGNDKAKQAKLRRIKNKLLSGKKLSDEELGFLRVNDPKLYKKAKAADEAREELKEELKRAKSKSEAREAMTRAMVKASTEAMAELSSLGQGGGSALAGGGGAVMQAGGGEGATMSPAGDAMNISGGEGTAAEGNVAGAETQSSGAQAQSSTEVNQPNQTSDEKTSVTDKTSAAQKNSDADSKTPEDIMEKYLMIIRALEDEWAQFTNSKEYKDLPEHTIDEATHAANKKTRRLLDAPNRKVLEATALYRKAMLNSLS